MTSDEGYEGLAMPKINVYLPDDLAEAVREAGIPVSAVCQRALEYAVRRVTAIRETALSDLSGASLTEAGVAEGLTQLTARAREVLRLSIERAAGEPAVGTGHILAGMLTEGRNLGLGVLRSMDIEPARVERDLAQRPLTDPAGAGTGSAEPSGPGVGAGDARDKAAGEREGGAGRGQRFSGPAANALEQAVSEATALGHNYVGCEHLLIGLVAEPDGVAGQILRSLGAEPRLTRRAVAAAVAGYAHLKTTAETKGPKDPAEAIRAELRPLIARIERLEAQLKA
jgi:ATP-dependent Clp protease ATP-binding subunit ClpC